MRRRHLLAILPSLAVAGCTAPTPDTGIDEADTTSPPATQPRASTDWSIDLQVRGVECTSQDTGSATLDIGEETVTVHGTIIGSNTCHVARMDAVTYDEETAELVLLVESVEEAGEDIACAPCITAIDYTVVVTFSGPRPDRMVVRHRRGENRRTVIAETV